MNHIASALAAAFLAAGAASAQIYAPYEQPAPSIPPANTGDYRAVRTVAIVSALGPVLRIGTSDGTSRSADVSGWKADELAAATLRRYLGGRFRLVEAQIDTDALRAVPEFMRELRTLEFLRKQPAG